MFIGGDAVKYVFMCAVIGALFMLVVIDDIIQSAYQPRWVTIVYGDGRVERILVEAAQLDEDGLMYRVDGRVVVVSRHRYESVCLE